MVNLLMLVENVHNSRNVTNFDKDESLLKVDFVTANAIMTVQKL